MENSTVSVCARTEGGRWHGVVGHELSDVGWLRMLARLSDGRPVERLVLATSLESWSRLTVCYRPGRLRSLVVVDATAVVRFTQVAVWKHRMSSTHEGPLHAPDTPTATTPTVNT